MVLKFIEFKTSTLTASLTAFPKQISSLKSSKISGSELVPSGAAGTLLGYDKLITSKPSDAA